MLTVTITRYFRESTVGMEYVMLLSIHRLPIIQTAGLLGRFIEQNKNNRKIKKSIIKSVFYKDV